MLKYTEVQSQQMTFSQSPSVSKNPKIPTNYLIFAERFYTVSIPDICLFWYATILFRPVKDTPKRGKEAPRMDYLDVQLHFDEIVEDNRRCEALMDGEGVTFVTYSEDEWRELGQKRGKF